MVDLSLLSLQELCDAITEITFERLTQALPTEHDTLLGACIEALFTELNSRR